MLFSAVSSFSFEILCVDGARAAVALRSGHQGHVGIQSPGVEVKWPNLEVNGSLLVC